MTAELPVVAGSPEPNITLSDLYALVDGDDVYAVVAVGRSGGLRRGNLAVLIRYWSRGAGRAKIGWGRDGDFNRCVRQLSKYVPAGQVHGFCARLHKRALGVWPGEH